jgi:hypothetical protein
MDARVRNGIAFLQREGWNPSRAIRASQECQEEAARSGPGSRASREKQEAAIFAVDSVLQGFAFSMDKRVRVHVEFGGNVGDAKAQEFLRLRREAVALMSRFPGASLFNLAA